MKTSDMGYEGQVPSGKAIQKEVSVMSADEAERLLQGEDSLNESIFSRLNHEYEQANRTVNYLEQALEHARVRQAVLSSAVDRLNAPQAPAPSLR